MWHFENKSQIDDLQSQIQHQNNVNKSIQNRLQIKSEVAPYEFEKKIEVLQNRLREADEKIEIISFESSISKCFLKRAQEDISGLNTDVYLLQLNNHDQNQCLCEKVDELKTLKYELAKKEKENSAIRNLMELYKKQLKTT